MCLRDTGVRSRSIIALLAISVGIAVGAEAQIPGTAPLTIAPAEATWKRVSGTTIDAGLAGAASGPIAAIWYAAGTGRLLVETESSRVFETGDFIHWRLNTDATAPNGTGAGNTANVQAAGSRLYRATPSNIYASDDSGRTWLNLTGYNNRSVIGDGFTGIAIAPGNAQEIATANRFGVWR